MKEPFGVVFLENLMCSQLQVELRKRVRSLCYSVGYTHQTDVFSSVASPTPCFSYPNLPN